MIIFIQATKVLKVNIIQEVKHQEERTNIKEK